VTGQPSKSIEEVAGEVIQGKYANGKERRKKLCDMGYDPDAVQREVNRQLSQNEAPAEYYVVQENDTLSEIAKCFATTYLELAAWNGIADPNMIYVGQKIRIR
jgi:LysM repeat protein